MNANESILWTPHECVRTAHELHRGLGVEVIRVAESNLEAIRRTGDAGQGQFWSRVCRAVQLIASSPCLLRIISAAPGMGAPEQRRWALMQQIEACRHLVVLAEEISLESQGVARAEALDLAAGWRAMTEELEASIAPAPPILAEALVSAA
jgi:hypothetical protein